MTSSCRMTTDIDVASRKNIIVSFRIYIENINVASVPAVVALLRLPSSLSGPGRSLRGEGSAVHIECRQQHKREYII